MAASSGYKVAVSHLKKLAITTRVPRLYRNGEAMHDDAVRQVAKRQGIFLGLGRPMKQLLSALYFVVVSLSQI